MFEGVNWENVICKSPERDLAERSSIWRRTSGYRDRPWRWRWGGRSRCWRWRWCGTGCTPAWRWARARRSPARGRRAPCCARAPPPARHRRRPRAPRAASRCPRASHPTLDDSAGLALSVLLAPSPHPAPLRLASDSTLAATIYEYCFAHFTLKYYFLNNVNSLSYLYNYSSHRFIKILYILSYHPISF